MQENFAKALTSLWELAGEPIYESTLISTSTFGDWKTGKSVPKNPQPLQKVVTRLRLVAYNRRAAWSAEEKSRYEQLNENYLEALRGLARSPAIATLNRLRELSDQAVADAAVLQEPSTRFPHGIRLEDLHVPRAVEHKVLAGVPDRCAQLVVGEPGSGKTTILWSLHRALSERDGVEALFVKATYLLDALRQDAASAPTALTVKEIMEAARCCAAAGLTPVLLIDTLDQLMHSQEGAGLVARLLVETQRERVSVIVSCRPGEAMLLPFDEIAETGERQSNSYLRSPRPLGWYSVEERKQAVGRHSRVFCPDGVYGPGAAQRLEDDIMGAVYQDLPLKEVCDNPLFLRLLFDVYAPEAPARDVDVASLFDRLRDLRVERDGRAGQGRIVAELYADRSLSATAQALARYMLGAQTLEFDTRTHWHHLAAVLPGKSPEDIQTDLEQLSRRGIVATIPSTATLRFFHQTFFEYMAAEYLRASHRGGELVARLLEYPDDLVLAAVAGQLIPREKAGKADKLLEPLLNNERTAALGLEFYAQIPRPGKVAASARRELRAAAPEAVKRFLKLLPGHRHPDSERWLDDLITVWERSGEPDYAQTRTVRFQLLETVRRLLHQHPTAAIEFLAEGKKSDRLDWLLSMEINDLSGHKDRFLGLLSAVFRYDPKRSLTWTESLCLNLLKVGKGDVVADLVSAIEDEANRISDPDRRSRARRQALATFEKLLSEPQPKSRKKPAAAEQAIGTLWASCHDSVPAERLPTVLSEVFTASMDRPVERARLRGASLLARRLSEVEAQALIGHLLAAPVGNARTALRYHVLRPILRAADDSPFCRLLRAACRDALRRLSLPAEDRNDRSAESSWLVDAVVEASPAAGLLLEILPAEAKPDAWLARDGLSGLLVPAAVAGRSDAVAALERWSVGEPGEGVVWRGRQAIGTALGTAAAQYPALLSHLVQEARSTAKTSVLTAAVDAAAQQGHLPSPQVTAELRDLVVVLGQDDSKNGKLELYRLYRALVQHAGWAPPAPADLVEVLETNSVGKPLNSAVLGIVRSAVLAGQWTYYDTLPLLHYLTGLIEAGQIPARHNGDTVSVHHVLAVIRSRQSPVSDHEERDLTVSALLELVLPEGGSPETFVGEDVREIGWLLQRIATEDLEDAAIALSAVSQRLDGYTTQDPTLTTHIAYRWAGLLETLLTGLGVTARRELVLNLIKGDPSLARKAVTIFAALHETSLTAPPRWFRDLANHDNVPPLIQQIVTARLRLHARMQCGEPWPELLDDPSQGP